jgi:hypothetical protein
MKRFAGYFERRNAPRCATSPVPPSLIATSKKGRIDSVPNRPIRLCRKLLLRTEPSVPFCVLRKCTNSRRGLQPADSDQESKELNTKDGNRRGGLATRRGAGIEWRAEPWPYQNASSAIGQNRFNHNGFGSARLRLNCRSASKLGVPMRAGALPIARMLVLGTTLRICLAGRADGDRTIGHTLNAGEKRRNHNQDQRAHEAETHFR